MTMRMMKTALYRRLGVERTSQLRLYSPMSFAQAVAARARYDAYSATLPARTPGRVNVTRIWIGKASRSSPEACRSATTS